jgi:RNA polymerase-binding protein DksA
MKKETLEKFKDKLLEMRKQLLGDFDNIQANSLSRRDDLAGDLSSMPIHMADVGSDTFEKEFACDLIASEQTELREIEAALGRLVDGSFGVCEVCGKKIGIQRLTALAYARHCIECQRKEEAEGA